MAHKTDQTGHRLDEGVPGLLGQFVAVAGRAGGGVAHAAGGLYSRCSGILVSATAGFSGHIDPASGYRSAGGMGGDPVI